MSWDFNPTAAEWEQMCKEADRKMTSKKTMHGGGVPLLESGRPGCLELADRSVSKTDGESRAGSSPAPGTKS